MRDRIGAKYYLHLLCKGTKIAIPEFSYSKLHDTNYSRLSETSRSVIDSDMTMSL